MSLCRQIHTDSYSSQRKTTLSLQTYVLVSCLLEINYTSLSFNLLLIVSEISIYVRLPVLLIDKIKCLTQK